MEESYWKSELFCVLTGQWETMISGLITSAFLRLSYDAAFQLMFKSHKNVKKVCSVL